MRSSNVGLRWLACAILGVASNTLGLGVADKLEQVRAHMSSDNEGSWKDHVRLPVVRLVEEDAEALQGLAVAILGVALTMILSTINSALYTFHAIVETYQTYGWGKEIATELMNNWLGPVNGLVAFLICMGPITLGRAKLRLQDKLNSLRTCHDLSWKASALEALLDKSNGRVGFGFAAKGAVLVDADFLFGFLVKLLLLYGLFVKAGDVIYSSQYLQDSALSEHNVCTSDEVAQHDGEEWAALQSEILSTLASHAKPSN